MDFQRLCVLVLFSMLLFRVTAQESSAFTPHGRAFGVIFANFHHGISEAASDEAAFEIVRAYLGYEHQLSPEFSARINLDIGSPDDVSPYSKLRRYAYFKNAYVQYEKEALEVQFGLISLLQYKLQEQIWERRYLKKSFADEFKLGSSADLGMMARYRFSPALEADLTMMNGEGYSSLQMDNYFKYGAGVTLEFPEGWVNRVYFDYYNPGVCQTTLTWVSSFTWRKNLNLTAEYNSQDNSGFRKGRDLFGWSFYGKYNLTPKYQLFARYDILRSNKVAGGEVPWHLSEDGSMLIAGVQFTPIKNIKIALDYQDWVPWAANLPTRSFIFVDMEVKL